MSRTSHRYITVGSFLALVLGFAAGGVSHLSGAGWLGSADVVLGPVGELWIRGLRMIILPLVSSYLLVAILEAVGRERLGRLGAVTAAAFLVLLFLGGAYSLAVSPWLARLIPITEATRSALLEGIKAPPAPGEMPGFRDWVVGLVPTNVVAAAARDEILGVIVFTLAFAVAFTRIEASRRDTVLRLAHAVRDATQVVMGWLLATMPVAVFAITFRLAAESGAGLGSAIAGFVVTASALLLGFILLLYLVATIVGGASPRRFARALARPQIIAAGTRSSLATLPALMEGAREELELSDSAVGLVLPLSVSVFKVNRPITGALNLLFLGHLYGIPVPAEILIVFVLSDILTSFGSPGIPSGGQFLMLPFYLAAGIPVEGVVLLKAADAIPDIFKTIANVTADMTVAVVAARFAGGGGRAGKEASAAPAAA